MAALLRSCVANAAATAQLGTRSASTASVVRSPSVPSSSLSGLLRRRPPARHGLAAAAATSGARFSSSDGSEARLLGGAPIKDAEAISHIAFAFMGSKALFTALDIGVFTHLSGSRTMTLAELNAAVPHVPERSLQTLMTCLTSLGLVNHSDAGFSNVEASEAFLVRGAKHDFGDYLRFQIDKQMYPFMEHCSDVLQNKPSAAKAVDYEQWMSDPVEARLYTESQHAGSTGPARGLSKKIPEILGECRTLLDVGGGSGGFSITLAKQWPELSCTVVDFPNVCAVGRDFVERDGMGGRVDFLEGNALTTDFPGERDAVLMSYISSSVGGDDLPSLYSKAFAALKPGGSVFVHDFMVEDDRTGPPLAALWALQHMVFTPGAVSITPAHLTGLLEGAGFGDVQVWEMIPGLTKVAVATKPL